MNDDYLWDRSGEPDPEIERLESLLSRYRHKEGGRLARLVPAGRRPALRWLAVAAALILIVGAVAIGFAFRLRWRNDAAWDIVHVEGAPTLDGKVINEHSRLAVGQELRTDVNSRVTVAIARVGELEVGPGSRVTLVDTGTRRHRMRLESGRISARVWAPQFTFGVRTPAGLASDIGCAFTLHYGEGAGEVRVTSGWVDFDGATSTSLIPANAVAELRDEGPGTPYYSDSSPEFQAALRAYDFEDDRDALRRALTLARPRDAMSLLHILEHARDRDDRAILYDALVKLAPPPPGVTREGVIDHNREMQGAWRQSLGLGGVKKWWIHWRDALPRK